MGSVVMKWIQAILLSLSLIFIVCFIYMFIANAALMTKNNARHHDHQDDMSSSSKLVSKSKTPDNEVAVKTTIGVVKGFKQDVFGVTVDTFLGIPYAMAPTGSLRFRKPAPLLPKKFAIEAKTFRDKCVQVMSHKVPIFTDVSSGMSEDCLYLNIWSPKSNSTNLKSVMIWIYGGGFFMGTSNFDETDGRVLAAFGDVVVVTFDYRLGGLGFVDLGTEREAGNQGLYDQLAAIRWVRDNIKYFGGDPTSMTLFGESSGAIAIGLHMMSPESGGSGLASRVILQSGSPFMTNQFYQRGDKSVADFISQLGCSQEDEGTGNRKEDEEDIPVVDLACLRGKTVDQVVQATEILHKKYFFAFPPTPEEDFIPTIPSSVTKMDVEEKKEIFGNVGQVMIGTNVKGFSYMLYLANEEVFSREKVSRQMTSTDDVKEVMSREVNHLLQMPPFQINFITQRLFSELDDLKSNSTAYLERLIEILGDMSFVCPSNILQDELAALDKDVFAYQFRYQSKTSPWGGWFGATLHDEIPLVFGHPLRYPFKYDGDDIDLSKRLMMTWTTFAKTGRPDDQLGTEWPKYTTKDKAYMTIDKEEGHVKRNLSQDSCETFRLGFELLN